jgi:SOS-response transcriptional repressor LexA
MTNDVTKMTREQVEIFELIHLSLICNGFPPTNSEIAQKLNCTPQNVNFHLQKMNKNGFIKLTKNIARGIKLIHKVEALGEYGSNY